MIDFNLLHQPAMPQTSPATALQKLSSQDAHSLQGDALFVDKTTGDYRVKANSRALFLGFVNFNMDDFGVQSPKLKAIAWQPVMSSRSSDTTPTLSETRSREVAVWAGAKVRNIVGLGEVSAAGSPGETGVILLEVPDTSDAAKAGFFAGDVLLAFNGKPIKELKDLLQETQQNVAREGRERHDTPLSAGVYHHDHAETLISLWENRRICHPLGVPKLPWR